MAVAVTVIVARWGTNALERFVPRGERRLRLAESQFAMALGVLFALSALAVWIGVAAIVGAFLAGLALAESTGPRVRQLSNGVAELLVPFFLAGIGMQVDLSVFRNWSVALLALAILGAAVASKFAGCGLAAWGMGRTQALRIGAGMIPRGEVGMVVAQIGLGAGIIRHTTYGGVVCRSVATTLLAPPLIKMAYRGARPAAAEETFRME